MKRVFKYLNRPRFIIPVIILAFGIVYIKDDKAGEKLLKHYSIADGTFKEFVSRGRNSGGVDYTFEINGKIYAGSGTCYSIKTSTGFFLIGHHFPVAYQVGDTDNNKILISPANFKAFRMAFPDSLLWVKPFLKEY